MTPRGTGPGNRAFLEHGSCSVSCAAWRLPFDTTMQNLKFQHFTHNKAGQTLSRSFCQSSSASEAYVASCEIEAARSYTVTMPQTFHSARREYAAFLYFRRCPTGNLPLRRQIVLVKSDEHWSGKVHVVTWILIDFTHEGSNLTYVPSPMCNMRDGRCWSAFAGCYVNT